MANEVNLRNKVIDFDNIYFEEYECFIGREYMRMRGGLAYVVPYKVICLGFVIFISRFNKLW